MSIPLGQARSMVLQAMEELRGCVPASTALVQRLEKVAGTCAALRGGGYKLERLSSTMMLANEVLKIQREQQARMAALLAGLNEVR